MDILNKIDNYLNEGMLGGPMYDWVPVSKMGSQKDVMMRTIQTNTTLPKFRDAVTKISGYKAGYSFKKGADIYVGLGNSAREYLISIPRKIYDELSKSGKLSKIEDLEN